MSLRIRRAIFPSRWGQRLTSFKVPAGARAGVFESVPSSEIVTRGRLHGGLSNNEERRSAGDGCDAAEVLRAYRRWVWSSRVR